MSRFDLVLAGIILWISPSHADTFDRYTNPILAQDEDYAQSALKANVPYPQLIDRIIRLGLGTVRD